MSVNAETAEIRRAPEKNFLRKRRICELARQRAAEKTQKKDFCAKQCFVASEDGLRE
jgi:hypothetical protein